MNNSLPILAPRSAAGNQTADHPMSPRPSGSGEVDVIVLGGGVVGTATAYALARRGLSVAIIDRKPGPAFGASFANGAQLSYAYSDTLGGPSLLRKLPSLALGGDPLLKVKLGLDPEMVRWGLAFLAACSGARQRSGTLEILALALESQQALHNLLERHPLSFGHATPGKMHLYFDIAAFKAAQDGVMLKRAHGAVQQVLSSGEALAIEPALEGARGLAGVVYSPGDEVGDAHRFSVGLVEVLQQHYGVQAHFGIEAQALRFGADGAPILDAPGFSLRGRSLVAALGVDAAPFLARAGLRVPVLPMKGYSFTAPLGDAAPRISLTDTARKLVFCQLSGRMRVAGVAELGVSDARIDPVRLAQLVDAARASLPEAVDYAHLDSGWAGLRPMTPSSAPIISRPRKRLILNIGHGMLGWTLAMGSAERAAKLTLDALKITA